MTETLTRARATKQDWRRHVLALVLFAVLVFYTVVSPSYTPAPLRRAADAEPPDAEERGAGTRAAVGPFNARSFAPRPDEFKFNDDELDWPEIIGDD